MYYSREGCSFPCSLAFPIEYLLRQEHRIGLRELSGHFAPAKTGELVWGKNAQQLDMYMILTWKEPNAPRKGKRKEIQVYLSSGVYLMTEEGAAGGLY
jgi:hypothetical protein